ncbi:MAG: hypothetical protein SNJ70_03170 [Armatimonadota bacterium]
MRRLVLVVICLMMLSTAVSSSTMWDYQAVNANGQPTHPLVGAPAFDGSGNPINQVVIEGIALAGRYETFDPNFMYIIFLQGIDGDMGGMQVFSGRGYHQPYPWPYAGQINFNAGDRLRITGWLGFYAGQIRLNERHDPDLKFTVELIEANVGLPAPYVMPSISECNYFDETKAGGGEKYQIRHVQLNNVQIKSGTWAAGQTLKIEDETGEIDMLLLLQGTFTSFPSGKISVVGIFDQEDTTPPFTEGYRVLIRNQGDVAKYIDYSRQARNITIGEKISASDKYVTAVFPGFFYIQDANRQGGIRVISNKTVSVGDRVSVFGALTDNNTPEKAITADYVSIQDTDLDRQNAIAVNGKTLANEAGLDVFGQLIRVVGYNFSTTSESDVFEITTDIGQIVKIKAYASINPTINVGDTVGITAIATTEADGVTPMLLLYDTNDIVKY